MVWVGLDNDKFISTEAGKGVTFTNKLFQSLSNRSQHQIADGMSLGIIDELEAIKVKEEDTNLPVFTASQSHGL